MDKILDEKQTAILGMHTTTATEKKAKQAAEKDLAFRKEQKDSTSCRVLLTMHLEHEPLQTSTFNIKDLFREVQEELPLQNINLTTINFKEINLKEATITGDKTKLKQAIFASFKHFQQQPLAVSLLGRQKGKKGVTPPTSPEGCDC